MIRKGVRQGLIYCLLVPLAVVFTLPLVWLLSTSLKSDAQMAAWPPVWIPSPLRWDNFREGWIQSDFLRCLMNTLSITVLASFGQMLTCSMAAFGFARLRFPGRKPLFIVLLATMMLPGVVTLIPTFVLFRLLGWLDSFKPLIVPAYFGGGAFFIFLLRQFFLTLPRELFEQATIDGASNYRQYWQIMLPLCKPALSTVAIFAFMWHWNDFMGPLIYLNDNNLYTLSLGLRMMYNTYTGYGNAVPMIGPVMAASVVMTAPVILIFFVGQKYFIEGIVTSGLKG